MAQNLKINILAKDKTKQAFNGIRGRLQKLKDSVISVKGALVGVGAGIVIKQFVDVGRTVEDLQVRLKQLFGSTQEGAKAFDVMANFAAKVPFSLEQIQAASGNLAVVAGDADRLAKILEITGNVAAVTGLDFQTTGEQIQRSFSAGIASADIFRERGVRDMLGFSAGATVSAEETIKAFEKVFGKGGKFGNATDELANTFTGTLSMLSDSVFKFQKRVADADFFASLKKEFKDLDDFIKQNEATFNDIADAIGATLTGAIKLLSGSIKAIAVAVDSVTTAYDFLINTVNKIPFVEIQHITKAQRQLLRELMDYEDNIMRIERLKKEELKATIKTTLANKENTKEAKKVFHIFESHHKLVKAVENAEKRRTDRLIGANRNIFDEQQKLIVKTKEELSTRDKIVKKIKDQNKEFDLSNEIFEGINNGVKSVSRGLAESLVLGKNIVKTFKDFAQNLLVEIIAKTIERIALLGIEKLLSETLFKKEAEKENAIRKQNTALKQQIALQLFLAAIGGGGGGIPFFNKGGSVSKNKPVVVGDSASGRGGELFVPNSSGQIIPNSRLGSMGGGVNVNFNINTVDASGFEELLVRSRGTITQLINNAVNEKGRSSII
jgi:hypothetical protein